MIRPRGEYGLYRVMMKPRAGGPRTHFHRTISESFYVLEGTIRLFNGEKWIEGEAGDFLHVPQGGLHAFRNDADSPAEMLLLFTPGAPRESPMCGHGGALWPHRSDWSRSRREEHQRVAVGAAVGTHACSYPNPAPPTQTPAPPHARSGVCVGGGGS